MKIVNEVVCHAGRDGDCWWKNCPQEANNRADWQEICPLAKDEEESEQDYAGVLGER